MGFPFFRPGESEPTFQEEVGSGEGDSFYFPEYVDLFDVEKGRFETYKRMRIVHNGWTHFAFVIPGAEKDALSWFKQQLRN